MHDVHLRNTHRSKGMKQWSRNIKKWVNRVYGHSWKQNLEIKS